MAAPPVFEYWQLCNGAWLYSFIEPEHTIKQSWYRRYVGTNPHVWRYIIADGCDNPGLRTIRVNFNDLPPELRLTLTLLEK